MNLTILLLSLLLIIGILLISVYITKNENFVSGELFNEEKLNMNIPNYSNKIPKAHNSPYPFLEWFKKSPPYNLLKKINLYRFNPKNIDTTKLSDNQTNVKGSYNNLIYNNEKVFCRNNPSEFGCPNYWLFN